MQQQMNESGTMVRLVESMIAFLLFLQCHSVSGYTFRREYLYKFLLNIVDFTQSNSVCVIFPDDQGGTGKIIDDQAHHYHNIDLVSRWFKELVKEAKVGLCTSKTLTKHVESSNDKHRTLFLFLGEFPRFKATFEEVHRNSRAEVNESIVWLTWKPQTRDILKLKTIAANIKLFLLTLPTNMTTSRKPIFLIEYAHTDYVNSNVRLKYLGNWTSNTGLHTEIPITKCCYDLTDFTINLVIIEDDWPYTAYKNNTFIGIFGDVFTIIAKHLKIRIGNITAANTFGGEDENGNPTGLFAWLKPELADLALTGLLPTAERLRHSDMTRGVMKSAMMGIYYDRPDQDTIFSFYIKPFNKSSWILVLSSYVVLILINIAVNLLREYWNIPHKNIYQDINIHFGAFFHQGASGEDTDQRMSWRIFHISLIFLGTMLIGFYSSKIVEEKAAFVSQKRFRNLADVAAANDYYPFVMQGTATYALFQSATNSEYSAIWKRISKDLEKHSVKSMREIYPKLKRDRCVFIGDGITVNYMKVMDKDLELLEESYYDQWSMLTFRKNFPLTKLFDQYILLLHSTGVIEKIQKPFTPGDDLERTQRRGEKPKEIDLSDTTLSFFILTVGVFLCFLGFMFERFLMKKIHRHRAKFIHILADGL